MTNPSNRANAPGRARDASLRSGTFTSGHTKVGGRKKGTPNAMSFYKWALFEVADLVGWDGKGTDGIVGYLKRLLLKCPGLILDRLVSLAVCGWPLEAPSWTMEEINERLRNSAARVKKRTFQKYPEVAAAAQSHMSDLIAIAEKQPELFAKLLLALLPRPTAQLHRACWEARHATESSPLAPGRD